MTGKKFALMLAENWPAKVFSIAFALILFVFNQMNSLSSRTLFVPLAIQTDAALVADNSHPQNVRVSLRGDDEGIRSILDSDIEAYVDLSRHETEGVYRAPVRIRRKGSALTIEPLEITVIPREISISLDRRITKTVPLEAVVRGSTAAGFGLISHSVFPAEIAVSGPFGVMESISSLKTEPVDIGGRNSDFRIAVTIVTPNPLAVIRGDGTAEFHGVIRPSVPVRNVEGIPIRLIGLAPAFQADMGGRTGSARLEAVQSLLDSFEPAPGFFTIDCSAITEPGTYTLPVMVSLPSGFFLIRREPEEITITITETEEEEAGVSG